MIYGPGFNPADPSHVPGIPGATQTIWTVANDLSEFGMKNFKSPPIGLELQITEWCYTIPGPLNNVIFQQFRIIYKGTTMSNPDSRIDSVYIMKWADTDIGDYTDDLGGCDSILGLGYVYNSNKFDKMYQSAGLSTPAVGFDILYGPAYYTGDENDSAIVGLQWRRGYRYWNINPLSAFFLKVTGGTMAEPQKPEGWYNVMRGAMPIPGYPYFFPLWGAFPLSGYPTKYIAGGDPVTKTGWIDGIDYPPGERRIGCITGPFNLKLGDTAEVVVALIGAMGVDNLSSVQVLKYYDNFVQSFFDNLPVFPIDYIRREGGVEVRFYCDMRNVYDKNGNPILKVDSLFISGNQPPLFWIWEEIGIEHSHLKLHDDGVYPDKYAGDGIYSIALVFPKGSLTGPIYFKFSANTLFDNEADEHTTYVLFVDDMPGGSGYRAVNELEIIKFGRRRGKIFGDTVKVVNKFLDYVGTPYKLYQNYPNPFNLTTSIKYFIPSSEHVILKIYNVLGQEVMTLVDEKQEPGLHEIKVSSVNLSSGVYFYRLIAGSFVEVKKMILIK